MSTLRELRKILGFETKFSILIDIDEKKTGSKTEVCEEQFLPRIRRWQESSTFSVRKYEDLEDLPVILVVVEKGKVNLDLYRAIYGKNLLLIDGNYIS